VTFVYFLVIKTVASSAKRHVTYGYNAAVPAVASRCPAPARADKWSVYCGCG